MRTVLSWCILVAVAAPFAHGLMTVGPLHSPKTEEWEQRFPRGSRHVANLPGCERVADGPIGDLNYIFMIENQSLEMVNQALEVFAEVDYPVKKLIVMHGKPGHWEGDWTFTVTSRRDLLRHRFSRERHEADVPLFEQSAPYITLNLRRARIKWEDVVVPEGIEVVHRPRQRSSDPFDVKVLVHGIDDGRPIEGATVEVWSPNRADDPSEKIREGMTGERGRFVAEGVDEEPVEVVVRADGYIGEQDRYVSHQDMREGPFVMGLSRATEVFGRVVTPTGVPVGGAEVKPRNMVGMDGFRHEWKWIEGENPAAMTNADGTFHLTNVPEGEMILIAEALGWHGQTTHLAYAPITVKGVFNYHESGEVLIVALPAGEVRGEMENLGFKSETGTFVVHLSGWTAQGVRAGGRGDVDKDGRFHIENLAPGTYRIIPDLQVDGDALLPKDPGNHHAVQVTVLPGETAEITLDMSIYDRMSELR